MGTGFVAGLNCTGLCWIEKGCKRRSAVPHLTHTDMMQLAGLLVRAAGSLRRSAETQSHPEPVFRNRSTRTRCAKQDLTEQAGCLPDG